MLSKHDLEQWDILNEIEYGYYYDEHYGIGEGDIEFLLSIIGSEPKNILEVCCGSGRIFIPLAKAGHRMTGFDAHYGMLSRLHQKAKGLTNANNANVKYYYADALRHEFETGFDVVLVAFNVIQNIEHIDNHDPANELADYKAAQELFISKAAKSVKQGGHLFFAFELFTNQSAADCFVGEPSPEWFMNPEEVDMSDAKINIYGVRSKHIGDGGAYDPKTQLARWKNREIRIYPPHGEKIISEYISFKRNLTLNGARKMLIDNGLEIEQEYGGYRGEPIKENEHNGAVVFWARKM